MWLSYEELKMAGFLGTLTPASSANLLPSPLLETKYGLRLELNDGRTFKISDINAFPCIQNEAKTHQECVGMEPKRPPSFLHWKIHLRRRRPQSRKHRWLSLAIATDSFQKGKLRISGMMAMDDFLHGARPTLTRTWLRIAIPPWSLSISSGRKPMSLPLSGRNVI